MSFNLPPEIISTYLKRRREDLITLELCFNTGDLDPIHRIGHQLMGNARSFGFPELEDLANRLESLSAMEFQEKSGELLNEFRLWIESNPTNQ